MNDAERGMVGAGGANEEAEAEATAAEGAADGSLAGEQPRSTIEAKIPRRIRGS
jgi:hypothetical protein